MGWDTHGFEIGNTLDRRAYPAARPKRGAGIPIPPEELVSSGAAPFTRVWNFMVRQAGINARTIRVSPAMIGPAIVKSLTLALNSHEVAAGIDAMALGWSIGKPVAQRKGSNTINPPGQVIIESDTIDDNVGDNPLPSYGSPFWGLISSAPGRIALDYVITEPSFYIWSVWETSSINAFVVDGVVTVLNQVDRRALSQFTG